MRTGSFNYYPTEMSLKCRMGGRTQSPTFMDLAHVCCGGKLVSTSSYPSGMAVMPTRYWPISTHEGRWVQRIVSQTEINVPLTVNTNKSKTTMSHIPARSVRASASNTAATHKLERPEEMNTVEKLEQSAGNVNSGPREITPCATNRREKLEVGELPFSAPGGKRKFLSDLIKPGVIAAMIILLLAPIPATRGAGVTIITHGFNSDATGWINPMLQQIPGYASFAGTNFSLYQITVDADFFRNFSVTQSRIGGVAPTNSDSGEILIQLDWSALSVDPTYATGDIADQVINVLLDPNFIPELGGRPLVEFPIHLIGHSRGGALITDLAKLLGNQGIWADHTTTLDPHPVPEYGDPNVEVFANVLFADNYWQINLDSACPNGQSVVGAYNRFLTNLQNGDSCNHSDVHLWYHGTIDWPNTPITVDGATITSAERDAWWTSGESQGRKAGFLYSLIGGGNRLSQEEPAGVGNGRIQDGMNAMWDFGAGTSTNRSALTGNNGAWPNVIKFDLESTNTVFQGDAVSLKYFYQFSLSKSATATVQVYLDNDANPYNGDLGQIFQVTEFGTSTVAVGQRQFSFNTTNTSPGEYYVYAKITDGAHTRYRLAPGKLVIRPVTALGIVQFGNEVAITWSTNAVGFTLESATNLFGSWSTVSPPPVIVNGQNAVTNTMTNAFQFYRLKKLGTPLTPAMSRGAVGIRRAPYSAKGASQNSPQ